MCGMISFMNLMGLVIVVVVLVRIIVLSVEIMCVWNMFLFSFLVILLFSVREFIFCVYRK